MTMFTGIIQGIGVVRLIEDAPGLRTLTIEFPPELVEGLIVGASVSVSGTCLTVARREETMVTFELMQETLERTTLGSLVLGARVNLERSARVGDEIGGHLLSGHVMGTAEIISIERPENNWIIRFRTPREWAEAILPKGFIAVDGASLTVVDVLPDGFSVHLIPETLRATTFAEKQVGDRVNIELDSLTQAVVATVKRLPPAA